MEELMYCVDFGERRTLITSFQGQMTKFPLGHKTLGWTLHHSYKEVDELKTNISYKQNGMETKNIVIITITVTAFLGLDIWTRSILTHEMENY